MYYITGNTILKVELEIRPEVDEMWNVFIVNSEVVFSAALLEYDYDEERYRKVAQSCRPGSSSHKMSEFYETFEEAKKIVLYNLKCQLQSMFSKLEYLQARINNIKDVGLKHTLKQLENLEKMYLE